MLRAALQQPKRSAFCLSNFDTMVAAHTFADQWSAEAPATAEPAAAPNPLREYFESHYTGRGILKWLHYFELYHRHFQRFIGKDVHVLEVGIYSGGSLDMWRSYFGPRLHLYGVDIAPACLSYADARTKVFIGDQADRAFWRRFREDVPRLDIVVDDGGHSHVQQIATLEELLPHLQPGGVYTCEDVQGIDNGFAAYVAALSTRLNAMGGPSPFQRDIAAVHLYPYMAVIERRSGVPEPFRVERRGTEWQPFSVMKEERAPAR
jgi:hypothetical protein